MEAVFFDAPEDLYQLADQERQQQQDQEREHAPQISSPDHPSSTPESVSFPHEAAHPHPQRKNLSFLLSPDTENASFSPPRGDAFLHPRGILRPSAPRGPISGENAAFSHPRGTGGPISGAFSGIAGPISAAFFDPRGIRGPTSDKNAVFFDPRGVPELQSQDPYLGIGSGPAPPQIPLALVLRLMESGRFKEISEADFKCRTRLFRLICISGTLSVAAGFILFLVLLGSHLRHRPRAALIQVQFMEMMFGYLVPVGPDDIVRQQQDATGEYYAYRLNLVMFCILDLKNPNRAVDFHHEIVEFTLLYRGMAVGYDKVENVSHPAGTVLEQQFFVSTWGLHVPLNVGYTLDPELQAVNFEVVAEVITRSTMSILPGFKPTVFRLRFRCDLHQFPNGELVQHCKYHTAYKWKARDKELDHYRTFSGHF